MSFEETVLFLRDYSWIFDFKVTEILEDGTINKIPVHWHHYLRDTSLNRFNESLVFKDKPDLTESLFLQDFKSRMLKITVHNSKYQSSSSIDGENTCSEIWKGHSKKKIHEVTRFSQFLSEKFGRENKTCMVDVGSGLGYLDERLLDDGFDVVGIECNQKFHNSAIEKHKKRKLAGVLKMEHVHMNFSCNPECLHVLEDCVPEKKTGCFVALHACGDLTNQIIKAFLASSKFRSLAVISCCYQKMDNFPISQELKEVSCRLCVDFFNHYFLRLGANNTLSRWVKMSDADHVEHSNNVLFRAVLELFSKQKGLELKKMRRKATKSSETKDFQGYADNIQKVYDLNLTEEDKSDLLALYQDNKDLHQFVENLTGLQFIMQQVIEQLILTDRTAYLKEQLSSADRMGSKESDTDIVELVDLFDDFVSPRNTVIYAQKNSCYS